MIILGPLAVIGVFSLSFGFAAAQDGDVACADIVEQDQLDNIHEDVLKRIATYKRAHGRAVTYCPGNSTLFHQHVELDAFVRSSISSFDNSTPETSSDEDEDDQDVAAAASVEARQYRWFQNAATDCSIVCGEPNPDHCQELHRDRYYGYLYQDQGFNLAPGQQWNDDYGTCYFIMRNTNAPTRNFAPDGQLQVIEALYNNCLYWNWHGGRATSTVNGWLAFAGHRDRLDNANGVTQCLNSVNAKKRRRSQQQQQQQQQRNAVVSRDEGPDGIGPKPASSKKTGPAKKPKIVQGKIDPELLAAMERSSPPAAVNNATATLAKRQWWHAANINAGTMDWRIDCGTMYPGNPSSMIDDYIVYGGNYNSDQIVQPQSWSAVIYDDASFVIFNQRCCEVLTVDYVHMLHNAALLGFHNCIKRGGSGNYGSAAFGITPGVYFAWIKTAYLGDNNRMGRCINVY